MSNKSLHTPRGLARFSHLTTPDQYDASSKPNYNTGLIFDPSDPEVQEFLSKLEAIHTEGVEAIKADHKKKIAEATNGAAKKKAETALKELGIPKYLKDVEDRETGEPTGKVYLNFKTYAEDRNGNRKTIKFFDGRKQPFKLTEEPWGGSVLRVNFTPQVKEVAKKVFMTLWINAVQVLELRNGGGSGNADDLFGGDESDFEAPKVESFDDGVEDIQGDEASDGDY